MTLIQWIKSRILRRNKPVDPGARLLWVGVRAPSGIEVFSIRCHPDRAFAAIRERFPTGQVLYVSDASETKEPWPCTN